MIDLTPLDVRKKKGDFRRGLRGYDPLHVDDFLDIVADRLENLVRENLALQERIARHESQVADYREREKALTEALVTAQEMREEVRAQSMREANAARREAENDAVRIRTEAQKVREREEELLRRLRGRQLEFLQTYRAFLEREMAELTSVVRGLELNGSMGDTLMAPPRLPDAAAESGTQDDWAAPPEAPSPSADAGLADEWAGPARPPREAALAGAAEPELILSDDDVLPDDSDATTGAIGPTPPAREDRAGDAYDAPSNVARDTASDENAGPDRATPSQPARAGGMGADLGLDLIPELDDVAELGDVVREDVARPLDTNSVEQTEPGTSDARRSASRRRDAGDDTDTLLRSLFGDEH